MFVWNDNVRAAFIAFIGAIFPIAQMVGMNLTGDQVAQIMLAINLGLVFLALIFKRGQQPGDPIISAKGSESAPTKSDLKE